MPRIAELHLCRPAFPRSGPFSTFPLGFGGLMATVPDFPAMWRQIGSYVDRVLKGGQGRRPSGGAARRSSRSRSISRPPRRSASPCRSRSSSAPTRSSSERRSARAPIRAPRGTELSCKGWPQEAALRMLMNNLDPEVAERPEELVVYGGTGKAARNWEAFDAIVRDAASAWRTTRRCSCSRASRSACSARTRTRRAC